MHKLLPRFGVRCVGTKGGCDGAHILHPKHPLCKRPTLPSTFQSFLNMRANLIAIVGAFLSTGVLASPINSATTEGGSHQLRSGLVLMQYVQLCSPAGYCSLIHALLRHYVGMFK
jgi:hypothetical protein